MSVKKESGKENEDADPVGAPVPAEVRKAGGAITGTGPAAQPELPPDPSPKPRPLEQEKEDFTAEGSPPPGKVGPAEPVEDKGRG